VETSQQAVQGDRMSIDYRTLYLAACAERDEAKETLRQLREEMKPKTDFICGDWTVTTDDQILFRTKPFRMKKLRRMILAILIRNAGRTVSYEKVSSQLDVSSESLKVLICRIRKEVVEVVGHSRNVRTVWGEGYMWEK